MGKPNNNAIAIETTINAPIESVWQAWTDADRVLKWFGSDPKGYGVSAKLDVRLGGYFEVTFNNSDGAEHMCSGFYTDVEPLRKLSFSWRWKSEPGIESFVTVLLSPEDSRTRMNFEHANLGNASEHDYLYGWNSTFQKLDRLLKENGD